jgi:hypothetical protein
MKLFLVSTLLRCATLFIAGSLFICVSAQAVEFGGIILPSSTTVGGAKLRLNGVGPSTQDVSKVYVGALYLEYNSEDPRNILSADSGSSCRCIFYAI